MSCHSIPGIYKIQIVRCNDIAPGAMMHSICGNTVAVVAPSESIEFSGKPVLSWEETRFNRLPMQKATLEFRTVHHIPDGENMAFVVSTVGGHQFLIGTREGRFPVVNYTATTGDPGNSAAVRTYKITHIALKSVLPCVL